MTAGDVVTLVACPACNAPAGSWCVRHGRTQPGPLLCCVARFRVRSACPAGDLVGDPHTYVIVRVRSLCGTCLAILATWSKCAGRVRG